MDRKVLFQAILWSVAAYLIFQFVVFRLYPPPTPEDSGVTTPTTQPTEPEGATAPPAEQVRALTQPAPPGTESLGAAGAEEERTFTLGSVKGAERGPYRSEMRISNRGASVASVLLADYKELVDADDRYRLVAPVESGGQTLRSLTVETVLVDGVERRLADELWRAVPDDRSGSEAVAFECDVLRDGRPLVRIAQRYVLLPSAPARKRYDFKSELTVENLSDEAHEVRITMRGPVGIQQADRRIDDRRVNVGMFLDGAVQPRDATMFHDVSKNTQEIKLFEPQDQGRLWWVAAENKYFAFITTPVTPDGGEGPGDVYAASAVDLDGDPTTLNDVALRLVLGSFALKPGAFKTLHMEHYIGPKDKRVFLDDRNADYLRRNYHMLNQDQGRWCTFGWLTELMITLLNAFYAVVRNYGIAIFLLVLVVRIILHPITKKTQVNMVKMQQSMSKLQPKLEEVKKRYANDKQRLQQETMKVYKDAGVNPAGQMMSCLPMMLQMPIWVALYTSLNNNIAMRHEGFIWWIKDLTAPDEFYRLADGFSLPLVGEITALNLLPLLVGATMYIQQKLMPKAKPPASGQSDQAAQMQKQMQAMMPLMSVFMTVIFYNMPSGLNLYIMTSSILGALEQWRIRKHVEEAKREDVAGPAPARPGPRPAAAGPRRPGFLERLAKKADEAQKLRRRSK